MSTPTSGLSIAEAAARSGLSTDTLRYYEKDGLLLQPVRRSSGGHRRYGDADLQWIHLLTYLRRTGMPIRDIGRYAAMVRSGPGNEAERLRLMQQHRRRVLDRLAEVTEHLGAIEAKITRYQEAAQAVS